MTALFQRIPAKWRAALYALAVVFGAAVVVGNIAAPDVLSTAVEAVVKAIGQLTAIAAGLVALFNLTPDQ